MKITDMITELTERLDDLDHCERILSLNDPEHYPMRKRYSGAEWCMRRAITALDEYQAIVAANVTLGVEELPVNWSRTWE